MTNELQQHKFPNQLYNFLVAHLRQSDKNSNYMIKRFLEKPQEFADWFTRRIYSLQNVYDPAKADERVLQTLKDLVGFTPDLDGITGRLTTDQLRKVISLAIPLWKQKCTESGIENVIRLFVGKNPKIITYFDYRYVLGEGHVGFFEERGDMFMLEKSLAIPDYVIPLPMGGPVYTSIKVYVNSLVGTDDHSGEIIRVQLVSTGENEELAVLFDGVDNYVETVGILGQEAALVSADNKDYIIGREYSEFLSDIKVIDDGRLDRDLLKLLIGLERPSSERIFIWYLDFIDDFTYGKDFWNTISGNSFITDDFKMKQNSSTQTNIDLVQIENSEEWQNYFVSFKFKYVAYTASEATLKFYFLRTDEDNTYYLDIDLTNDTIELYYVRLGVSVKIGLTINYDFIIDFYHLVKVTAEWNDITEKQSIKINIDGSHVHEWEHTVLAANANIGTIGVETPVGQQTLYDNFELYRLT